MHAKTCIGAGLTLKRQSSAILRHGFPVDQSFSGFLNGFAHCFLGQLICGGQAASGCWVDADCSSNFSVPVGWRPLPCRACNQEAGKPNLQAKRRAQRSASFVGAGVDRRNFLLRRTDTREFSWQEHQ